MNAPGAKFEEPCFNIFSQYFTIWIVNVVLSITVLICTMQYLCKEKKISQKENAIRFYFEKPLKYESINFRVIFTLLVSFFPRVQVVGPSYATTRIYVIYSFVQASSE